MSQIFCNKEHGSLEKLPQSRAIVENGVHHRQCDHTARKAMRKEVIFGIQSGSPLQKMNITL
jgi:hypothetical protein